MCTPLQEHGARGDSDNKGYNEERSRLLKFKNAMSRRGRLPSGRMGRMPDFPGALYSPRDERPPSPTRALRTIWVKTSGQITRLYAQPKGNALNEYTVSSTSLPKDWRYYGSRIKLQKQYLTST